MSGNAEGSSGGQGGSSGISLAALFARGTGGLPPPQPIDFATLVLPASPNACLAGPEGTPGAQVITAPLAADPDVAWAALRHLGTGFPRTTLRAEWPERRQAQWVVRSAVLNFPDIVAGQVAAAPSGTRLFLYSRSLFGRYDFGVNRRRVEAWLAALRAALRQG